MWQPEKGIKWPERVKANSLNPAWFYNESLAFQEFQR